MSHAILIIEDEAVLAKNMAVFLTRAGYDARTAGSAEEGLAQLELFRPDAAVLDFNLPGMDGLQALQEMRRRSPALPVIMITGHGSVERAVEAMKAGATDFLTKPVPLAKLQLLLDKAFSDVRRDSALDYYRRRQGETASFARLLGRSPAMEALRQTMRRLLEAEQGLTEGPPPPVLITGETGTGKEIVARALHFSGARRDQPFVELNCASIPSQLLESELFGYERGAFTDARERKLGLVETAEKGTLFLDEIGDMDLALQAKLLRLLEERTVRRLGGLRDQKVDVRIIAATHRHLEQRVAEGRFRADLFFRLRVVHLVLPPLRERGDDIIELAHHFLEAHASRYGRSAPALTPAAQRALRAYRWPGNVRELRNVLEQALLLGGDGQIDAAQLALSAVPGGEGTAASGAPAAGEGGTLPELERNLLLQALRQTGWNVSKAARQLGISRDTLRYRIDKLGLGSRSSP